MPYIPEHVANILEISSVIFLYSFIALHFQRHCVYLFLITRIFDCISLFLIYKKKIKKHKNGKKMFFRSVLKYPVRIFSSSGAWSYFVWVYLRLYLSVWVCVCVRDYDISYLHQHIYIYINEGRSSNKILSRYDTFCPLHIYFLWFLLFFFLFFLILT